jgi:hypothetical protein
MTATAITAFSERCELLEEIYPRTTLKTKNAPGQPVRSLWAQSRIEAPPISFSERCAFIVGFAIERSCFR